MNKAVVNHIGVIVADLDAAITGEVSFKIRRPEA